MREIDSFVSSSNRYYLAVLDDKIICGWEAINPMDSREEWDWASESTIALYYLRMIDAPFDKLLPYFMGVY